VDKELKMADAKPISQGLKMALELGPVVAFFVLYMRIRDDVFTIGGTEYSGFIVATVAFIPVLLAAMGVLWKLTGKISRMQVFTAFMVIFFGGLTVWFNDERFFKMKTTIVYGFFVLILGIGLLRGTSLLAYVMEDMLPMTEEGYMILTRRITVAFAVLAIANELVWRTMSTDTWVKIETFGFPAALFVFLMLQSKLFEEHSNETDNR
jgi:intracellular septation protein